jgi:hypothetical protein
LLLLPLPLRRYAAGHCAAALMRRRRCRHRCAAAPMLPLLPPLRRCRSKNSRISLALAQKY